VCVTFIVILIYIGFFYQISKRVYDPGVKFTAGDTWSYSGKLELLWTYPP